MKTALITGSSRGIGCAIALALAKQKYNIVLDYRDRDDAADITEREILLYGANCLKIKCDVRYESEVRRMHEIVKKTFGFTDIIINNAGVAKGGLLQDTTEEEYDRIMDTNLKGVYNVSKVFCSDMITNKWGRIINISSIWGLIGGAYESIYSASKAGVIGFTKALAKELAPSGITVNCIAPGAIQTDMLNQFSEETLEQLKEEIPVGRLGRIEDISSIIKYLTDEKSDYITGQIINISGGLVV